MLIGIDTLILNGKCAGLDKTLADFSKSISIYISVEQVSSQKKYIVVSFSWIYTVHVYHQHKLLLSSAVFNESTKYK